MNNLDTLWYHADRQTDLLESVSRQMSQLSTRTQLDNLLKTVRHLEQMTEQDGKPKENSFSLHRIRLPRLHPVSYTHLDVYKRQSSSTARSQCSTTRSGAPTKA